MSEETSFTITVSTIIICGLASIFMVGSCDTKQKLDRDATELKQRQLMIEGGYEWRQVPTQFSGQWVKKEDK